MMMSGDEAQNRSVQPVFSQHLSLCSSFSLSVVLNRMRGESYTVILRFALHRTSVKNKK